MDELLKNIIRLIEEKYPNDLEFEKSFGLSRSTVSAWRKGKLKSYYKMIPQLSEHFSVSTDYIVGKTNIKNRPAAKGNEPISDDDARILDKLHKLSPDARRKYVDFLDVLLSNQNVEK